MSRACGRTSRPPLRLNAGAERRNAEGRFELQEKQGEAMPQGEECGALMAWSSGGRGLRCLLSSLD